MTFSPISISSKLDRRFLIGWVCGLLIILFAYQAWTVEPSSSRKNGDSPGEYEIKAIYLYNFLKFIKWPEKECDLHDGRSHRIAVVGDSPFNHVLLALQNELKQSGKDLEITFYGPYRDNIEFSCCCLLFINDSEQENLDRILDKVAGQPILTVADTDSFVKKGGMITLVSRENKIRWAVNRQPLKESGIQMSSKLLDIAVEVIDTTY